MSSFSLKEHPHRRFNPLTGNWVLVSPHRAKRPWQGQVEKPQEEKRPAYDPDCYLCPGNHRAGGTSRNEDYKETYVFVNDFSSLLPGTPSGDYTEGELFRAEAVKGICKVICFSPRHDLTIPEMEMTQIKKVVDLWAAQYEELAGHDFIRYVQLFENKGQIMGCSNPHPHGQIWSTGFVPDEPLKETLNQEKYYQKHGHTLLKSYLDAERKHKLRILIENDHFTALVPFWAVWPFESMIISNRPVARITELTDEERFAFADIYKRLTIMYDNLFEVSFPYSAGIHQAPADGVKHEGWHLHMHFYPPLLRSASVKKFMVGFEMLANPQRDITAELSARRLRELPVVHYSLRS